MAAMAVAVLLVTRGPALPGLAWNDELVYAAAGRHVADGHGPLSSFYHPDAITERGFPQPDVHMPGHAFVLGAAFRLAGPKEWVALLPSRLALIAAAFLLAVAIGPRWGERSALAGALLFLLFPPNAAFAHTAMSESVLTLLSTAFFALSLIARDRPSVGYAVALALLLGLGATHRETFLVYVPAACWVVARWPQPVRRRGLLAGACALGGWLALVVVPLYRARAPHPHVLSDVLLSGQGPQQLARTLAQNLLANLRALPLLPTTAWEWTHALQWLVLIAAVVVGWRQGGDRRWAAGLAALGFLGTWAVLAPIYPIADWRAVRMFMHALPPALVVLADALVARPAGGWSLRHASRWLAPAAVLVVTIVSLFAIGRDREFNYTFGRDYSEFLMRNTAGRALRLVVATKAYRYGWEAYPVAVVVWEATDLKRVRAVEQAVPLDAIVVRREEKRRFLRGLADGEYRRTYRPAPAEPFHARYLVFLAEGGTIEAGAPMVGGQGSSP